MLKCDIRNQNKTKENPGCFFQQIKGFVERKCRHNFEAYQDNLSDE